MMRTTFIFLLLFLSCALFGQVEEAADDDEYDEITRVHFFEANFSMYRPMEAFSSKIEKSLLYGFSIGYLTQIQIEKPSFLGLEVFHKNLGNFSRNYDALIGNEQLVLRGKVSSNAIGINGIYRYYPPLKFKRIEPYFEGQLGVKFLYTYLSETGSFSDDEPYDNFDFLKSDWVLTYGGGFGIQIHISDMYYLNLKTTYHLTVSGEYQKRIKEGLASIDFPQEAFESVQSSTDVIKMDIGLTILF